MVVVAWNCGAVTDLFSLPPHPVNHRNHLKLSASLPFQGGLGGVKVESMWGLGSLQAPYAPAPSFKGHLLSEVQFKSNSTMRTTFLGYFLGGPCLGKPRPREGAIPPPPSTIRKSTT